ncbi:MAG: ATP-binding protein [Terrimicrobiaceae bacterium]
MLFQRFIETGLRKSLHKPFVHILFGARQTGKSFLLRNLIPTPALAYDFSNPAERTRLLADTGAFIRECEALRKKPDPQIVVVDEAQNVPSVFDAVQYLYDRDKTRWRFVLLGSSARKLRKTGANLLPGRALFHRLMPLVLGERPATPEARCLSPVVLHAEGENKFPPADLIERLSYGELPGIVTVAEEDRAIILQSYATIYLEEEIRREGLVKDWGAFVNFLRLAAAESGGELNYASISRQVGLSLPTVKSHYQLLEDMFIGIRVPGWSGSPRKSLVSNPKFLIFDTGVRHAAAGLRPGPETVMANPGPIFEQWVGIELWKRLQYLGGALHHVRSKDGREIDFLVELEGKLFPIEVKWTDRPSRSDARHVAAFLADNSSAPEGFVICRCLRPQLLCPGVTALPWQSL